MLFNFMKFREIIVFPKIYTMNSSFWWLNRIKVIFMAFFIRKEWSICFKIVQKHALKHNLKQSFELTMANPNDGCQCFERYRMKIHNVMSQSRISYSKLERLTIAAAYRSVNAFNTCLCVCVSARMRYCFYTALCVYGY